MCYAKVKHMEGAAQMQEQTYISAEYLTRYVYDNAARGLTLSDMARHMHMNRTYACEVFRRTTGRAFSECVNDARIKRARLLLLGDCKLSAVAREAGYGSEVTFYRAFKRATGMTPGDFRDLAHNTHKQR